MKKLALGAIVVLVLAVAGCGGSDDGGGDAMTAEEYSAALNTICADFNTKQDEIGEPQNLEELADLGPQVVDEFEKTIAAAEDLQAPDELAEPAAEFISLGKQQLALLGDLVDAAADGDDAKASEIGAQISPLDDKSDDIAANQLNAPDCAAD